MGEEKITIKAIVEQQQQQIGAKSGTGVANVSSDQRLQNSVASGVQKGVTNSKGVLAAAIAGGIAGKVIGGKGAGGSIGSRSPALAMNSAGSLRSFQSGVRRAYPPGSAQAEEITRLRQERAQKFRSRRTSNFDKVFGFGSPGASMLGGDAPIRGGKAGKAFRYGTGFLGPTLLKGAGAGIQKFAGMSTLGKLGTIGAAAYGLKKIADVGARYSPEAAQSKASAKFAFQDLSMAFGRAIGPLASAFFDLLKELSGLLKALLPVIKAIAWILSVLIKAIAALIKTLKEFFNWFGGGAAGVPDINRAPGKSVLGPGGQERAFGGRGPGPPVPVPPGPGGPIPWRVPDFARRPAIAPREVSLSNEINIHSRLDVDNMVAVIKQKILDEVFSQESRLSNVEDIVHVSLINPMGQL